MKNSGTIYGNGNGVFGTGSKIFWVLVFTILLLNPAWARGAEHGGTLRIATELDAGGFDALKARATGGLSSSVACLVMEKLFERGEDHSIVPVLGLSAEESDDGKTWTVKLRQGVSFHDGTPFNADAVVHHWVRLLNPENSFRSGLLIRPILSVEKTGEFEVRFHLEHAWMPFLGFLTTSQGWTALIPSPKAVEHDTQNHSPVGTGPFVFKEWKPGDRVVVEKNPHYWQEKGPYLDQIVYRPVPDHESRYAAFLSGQVDVLMTDRAAHVKKLETNPDFIKHTLNYRGAGILVLNNSKPPLDDIRVRRALAMAWDQKQYIRAGFQDIVPFTEHWFGDAVTCESTAYINRDLEKARALISEYGKPVELEYLHSATNRGREAALIVRQMFGEIGVTINPVPSDFPGIMKKLFSGKHDICSWLIPGSWDMGPVSMAILDSKSPWNVCRYSNQEVDSLLKAQQLSMDPEFRKKTLCDIARKVNSEAPFLYLFGRTYYLFAKTNIHGIRLPYPGEEYVDYSQTWINN